MLRRAFLLALLPALLAAEDRWLLLKSKAGPLEVLSNAGEKPAREKLMYLEQFREALRVITGKQDMRLVWPIRVLVLKKGTAAPANAAFALGRAARMEAVSESSGFSRESLKALARILLYENTNRMPQPVEDGLIELLSTLEVDGPHITVGAPVPEAERSYGWALMQMVTVNPSYSGRSRVMISNLEQSGDWDAACRNAFEKTATQIHDQAEAYRKSGNFPTGSISGRALSIARDFRVEPADADAAKLALADLALAANAVGANYLNLHGAPEAEGLGLIALKEHKNAEALRMFQSAIESKSENPRAWLEAGRLETDPAKARVDLKKAAELNPQWGEPYFQLAEIDRDNPEQRVLQLKKAASLDVRNIDYWQALAKTLVASRNYPEAQKAWAGAERAAGTEEERARIHQVRLQVEQERRDFEVGERKRINDEREKDIQRVKAINDTAVHAAEEDARKRLNPEGAAVPKDAIWMDELKSNTNVEGVFERLDCIGRQARIIVKTSDGKNTQLLIRDPSGILLAGGGEKSIGCGAQSGSRRVRVEYIAKPDAKLRTIGEVTSIEFR